MDSYLLGGEILVSCWLGVHDYRLACYSVNSSTEWMTYWEIFWRSTEPVVTKCNFLGEALREWESWGLELGI